MIDGAISEPVRKPLPKDWKSSWADGTPLSQGGFGYALGNADGTACRFDGDAVRSGFQTKEPTYLNSAPYRKMTGRPCSGPVKTLTLVAQRDVHLALLSPEDGEGRTRLHHVSSLLDLSAAVQVAFYQGSTRALPSAAMPYTPAPPPTGPPCAGGRL